ncbi:MAG: hypothetical protein ACFE9N_07525 [Promethearchaeota archaeon]
MIPDKIKLGVMLGDMCQYGNVFGVSKNSPPFYKITKAIGNAVGFQS